MPLRIRELVLDELGPYEQWPELLKATLATMLASTEPMQLRWGPQALLFYNDAAAPLLASYRLGSNNPDAPDVRWRPLPVVENDTPIATLYVIQRSDAVMSRLAQELGTPLSPLVDLMETMLGGDDIPREHLELANRSVLRLRAVVRALAEVGHLDTLEEVSPAVAMTPAPEVSDRPRALVVAPGADAREYLVHALAEEWNVVEASDTASALVQVRRDRPEIVVADVEDEGLVHELRSDPSLAVIPVILLVSHDRLCAGVDDCLVKPCAARELRARARMRLELVRARRAVAVAAVRAKDDFLALIGHELRNPLSVLATTMQALMLRAPSREVDLMARALRQLTRLVDDLLDISRLARGTLTVRRERAELAQIVDRAMEVVASLAEERGVRIFVSLPRAGLQLDADRERFARVIANVLANAIQHSEAGMKVTVEAAREGERIRLTIRDEGAGIEPRALGQVFDLFAQPRSAGGLGLGLAIARKLVELHDGTIRIHSDGVGRGTTCQIDLPTAIVTQLATPPVDQARATRKRVLLVEDNDDAARALKAALEQLGYIVAIAHDGPVALNLTRAFEPEVVLLDIGLPVMDGWELARRLRERVHHLHFIAVTARDQEADIQRSVDSGFAEHLVKPIDLAHLERVVEGLPPLKRA